MLLGYAFGNSVEALNLGADGYLMKPVSPGCLLEFVEDKLWSRRGRSNTWRR